MPLDDTLRRTRAKPAKASPAPAKPDAFFEARAELDRTLAALLARAKTTKSRGWVRYGVASRAVSVCDAWRELEKKALIASGALPDYTANPLPVGTVLTVYTDPLVTAGVKVTPQSPRLNVDAFVADLAATGVKTATLRRLRRKHTTEFNGAHIITAMLAG